MKIHISISGVRAGTMDLDKKMPEVSKIYPGVKISKRAEPIECIKATGIHKDVKLLKIYDQKVDIDINMDLYATSLMSFTYLDIYFEIDIKLYELLNQGFGLLYNLFFNSKINLFGAETGFASILIKVLIPYYNSEKIHEIKEILPEDPSEIHNNIEKYFEETGVHFYCIDGPSVDSFNAGPFIDNIIIEDYNDEINVDHEKWEQITTMEQFVYHDAESNHFICRNKEHYKYLFEHNFDRTTDYVRTRFIKMLCGTFLNQIRKKGLSIRKNIIENNKNPYYWKELKNDIEIIDLNFLEFHTDAVKCSITNGDELPKTKKYRDNFDKKSRIEKKEMLQYLDEVKYSISNLATPSHVHDEAILQLETEKVNDRILMLSFIAMAVSAISMLQSNEIPIEFKIISGLAIFSLPALYYSLRGIQKNISFKRNRSNELKRIIDSRTKAMEKRKSKLETLKNDEATDRYPEGFKEELLEMFNKDMRFEEKTIEKLKAKL